MVIGYGRGAFDGWRYQKKYAYQEIEEIYKELGTSPEGLDVHRVDAMRETYGANFFEQRKRDTLIRCLRRALSIPSR